MKKEFKNVSIHEVSMQDIIFYGIIKNLYLEADCKDEETKGLLKKIYNHLDPKVFPYIDTDRDINDIKVYVKLVYEKEK